jgi:hypothetical protein
MCIQTYTTLTLAGKGMVKTTPRMEPILCARRTLSFGALFMLVARW